jgi:hypothetical protein
LFAPESWILAEFDFLFRQHQYGLREPDHMILVDGKDFLTAAV